MQEGGFDVIIGNPPYIEYSKVRSEYTLPSEYEPFLSNLYAATCFRATQLASSASRTSLIVPASLPSTDRMETLRVRLGTKSEVHHISFSTRPSKLFEGAEQRLTIYLISPSQEDRVNAGGYLKWYSNARQCLFDTLQYTDASNMNQRNRIWPKLANQTVSNIIAKIASCDQQIGLVAKGHGAELYYKNTGLRYFNTVTLVAPKCKINGKDQPSSRETTYQVKHEWLAAVHTVLMSTTFFLYYQALTNCRDLNPSDIATFPVPTSLAEEERLHELSEAIEKDVQRHSKKLTMNNKKTGKVELQSLSPVHSKDLIDQIDTVLASHFGFTDDELDFIINYDIKYRLGAETSENEE